MRLSKYFRLKAYCKVVYKSAKNSEATNFHGNPYYSVLPYLMISTENRAKSLKTSKNSETS